MTNANLAPFVAAGDARLRLNARPAMRLTSMWTMAMGPAGSVTPVATNTLRTGPAAPVIRMATS